MKGNHIYSYTYCGQLHNNSFHRDPQNGCAVNERVSSTNFLRRSLVFSIFDVDGDDHDDHDDDLDDKTILKVILISQQ